MRVLFSTSNPAGYMQPPRLGDEQINCGPDWPDERWPNGSVRSFATPAGEYDLAALAAKLPPEQQPDLVVCLVDASWRNLPRRLAALRCPRVLLVADTHHLRSPLINMLRYASAEPFDRIVFLYDRHHAAFFHAAGLKNLFWFPGLTFPHTDSAVRHARKGVREARIAFVGQAGPLHPRRSRLIGALASRGLPLAAQALPQREALGFYGASLLGFNASLNGDLNLRVFEILASGAALLTDRLAPEAGLERLLDDGREFASYGDSAELAELCEDCLAHPQTARERGRAGAKWFDSVLGEEARRAAFRSLAFDGIGRPEFDFDESERTRVFFGGDTDRLLQGLMIYEGVQELHRKQETVRVLLDKQTAPEDFGALCTTLPRVQLTRTHAEGDVDLAVFGREAAARMTLAHTARLWCWDAADEDRTPLTAHFGAAGFMGASRDLALFCRPETTAPAAPAAAASPAVEATQARTLLAQGNVNAAFALARSALERDPRSAAARVVLGEIALRQDGGLLAEKLFRQALALRADGAAVEPLLADALRAQRNFPEAGDVLAAALKARRHDLRALLSLAQLRLAEQQPAAAEAALREAVRHHPNSAIAAQALGDFLKRAGRIPEALGWHRRMLGCADAIVPVDPAARRVRVAFVMQNPQGWTSLESVWRAMRDDAAFETTIIAAPYQHPYPPEGGPEGIYGFLEKQGVPFVKWDAFSLRPGFADVVFVQNPYDVTRPAALHVPNLLKLVPRLAYVPYGLEIGGGGENNTMVMNLPLQQLAWLVCARSERQRQSYAKHCAAGNAHVVVTGHAKLDALRDLPAVNTAELEKFAAGRKIVGWNPHFDIRPKAGSPFGTGFSTFTRWWKFVLAEFARRPDLALVIRPHPLFFGTLESRRVWTRAQCEEFLRQVAAAKNILIDRNASYLPLFARADAMISDASSFVLEFAATGKPLLYLHNPHGPQLNDDGEFVGRCLYTAVHEDEMRSFLNLVAAGEDPLAEARRAGYAEFMHMPTGGAGVAVKRAVLDRLAQEAHAAGQNRALLHAS